MRWLGPGGAYGFAVMAALSLLGRLWQPAFHAAVLGSIVVTALVWKESRTLGLWFTGVLAAIWVSQRPPWEPLVASIVVAGVVFLLFQPPEGVARSRVVYAAFGLGVLTAAITAATAHFAAPFQEPADVAALVVFVISLRLGAAALLGDVWVAAVWMAAVAVPGQVGLLAWAPVAVETAGVVFIGGAIPAGARVAWALGGIAAAWPLYYLI